MKTLNKLFIAALATTAMTACNNELSNSSLNNDGTVNFTMGIGETASSRIAMEDGTYSATFSPNNAVGIFVEGQDSYKNLEYKTEDGSTWTGPQIKLPEGETYTYYAYYPYSSEVNTANAITINVAADQEAGGYLANDYLYCKTTSGETKVTLDYEHALSLIDVTLAGAAIGDDAVVSIINVATDATLDVTAPSVTTGTTLANVKMDVLTNTKNFRAIIPAQKIAASTSIFRIETKGKTYEAKYNSEINFEKGKYLALTITIGEEGGEPEIEITTSANINDWTEGGTAGGDITIGATEINVPLPTDGTFQTIASGWSSQVEGVYTGKIPTGTSDKWYIRDNMEDTKKMLYSYSTDESAIEFKTQSWIGRNKADTADSTYYSRGSWNNDHIVFHCSGSFNQGYYKLSFKVKSSLTTADGMVGTGIMSSNDDKVFAMYKNESSASFWERTVTTFGSLKNEWVEKSVIVSFSKTYKEGKSSSLKETGLSDSEITDVNQGINIIFYNYTNGVENSLYLKDIKIESHTFASK